MEFGELLQIICNFIILLGAVAGAIAAICALCDKPIMFFKKKKEQRKQAEIKEIISQVSTKVSNELQESLNKIAKQNETQTESINVLIQAMQDSLGAELTNFYEARKDDGVISIDEQLSLKDIYRAYKAVGGNHNGDRLWSKLILWTVLDDSGKKIENPDWNWKAA